MHKGFPDRVIANDPKHQELVNMLPSEELGKKLTGMEEHCKLATAGPASRCLEYTVKHPMIPVAEEDKEEHHVSQIEDILFLLLTPGSAL